MYSQITNEIFEKIITAVLEGRTLTSACLDHSIEYASFYRYAHSKPDLWSEYQRARAQGSDAKADEIIDISNNEPDVNRAKMQIDARKWHAAKTNPQVYGENIQISLDSGRDLGAALMRFEAVRRPSCDLDNILDVEVIETKGISGACTTGSKPVDDEDAPKIEAIETGLKAKKPND